MRTRHAAMVAGLALGLMSGTAQASYLITFSQVGSDVSVTGFGEFNTTLLDSIGQDQRNASIDPRGGEVAFNPGVGPQGDLYGIRFFTNSPNTSYGTGGTTAASVSSGALTRFDAGALVITVPSGYVSGTVISSFMLFGNQTFSTLGLTAGTYDYTYGNQNTVDDVIIRVGTVPLPASAPMFGSALLALGAVGYGFNRKKAAVTA